MCGSVSHWKFNDKTFYVHSTEQYFIFIDNMVSTFLEFSTYIFDIFKGKL